MSDYNFDILTLQIKESVINGISKKIVVILEFVIGLLHFKTDLCRKDEIRYLFSNSCITKCTGTFRRKEGDRQVNSRFFPEISKLDWPSFVGQGYFQ